MRSGSWSGTPCDASASTTCFAPGIPLASARPLSGREIGSWPALTISVGRPASSARRGVAS